MKIVRSYLDIGNIELSDSSGFNVDNVILTLQWAFHLYKSAACYNDAVFFERVRSKDDVGDAGFIFERQKHETFCGSWPLARDYTPCNANVLMVGQSRKVLCAEYSSLSKDGAVICERVRTSGEPGT